MVAVRRPAGRSSPGDDVSLNVPVTRRCTSDDTSETERCPRFGSCIRERGICRHGAGCPDVPGESGSPNAVHGKHGAAISITGRDQPRGPTPTSADMVGSAPGERRLMSGRRSQRRHGLRRSCIWPSLCSPKRQMRQRSVRPVVCAVGSRSLTRNPRRSHRI